MAGRLDARLSPDFREEPLWWEEARPAPALAAPLPSRCDVLVIGAGYAGLNCALTLARGGVDVVVVDAEAPGFGGSSRNGGQVTGGWNMIDLSARDQGAMRARVESGWESLRHFETLIETERLQSCYRPVGKYVAAFAPEHLKGLARRAEWASANTPLRVEALSRREAPAELGSDFYHGGVRFDPGGLVQPALYLRGLLERTRAAGARVLAPVRVERIGRRAGGYRLESSAGPIECEQVVLATNGYGGAGAPDLQRRVVPVASYIVATEPLPEELARRLIPRGRAVSDTARVLAYFRLSPDGRRMVFGGRASFRTLAGRAGVPGLHAMMTRRFPELAGVPISHGWTGNVAFARDRLPHVGGAEGLHWTVCCNGSGVAMMGYLGDRAARRILHRPNAPTCAFDGGAFPTIPLYRGRPWFLPAVGTGYRLRDLVDRLSAATV